MENVRWKPLPGYPGYEINRAAWVRNERGYVVASGKGVNLFVQGGRAYLSRPQLIGLAEEAFNPSAPVEEVAQPLPIPAEPLEPIYIDEDEFDVPRTVRRTCTVCGGLFDLAKMENRVCRTCAALPPKPKMTGRRCRKCKGPLPEGYHYNCPGCWHGRSSTTEDCYGVAL